MTEESTKERIRMLPKVGMRTEHIKPALAHIINTHGVGAFLDTLILSGNGPRLCECFLPEIVEFMAGHSSDPEGPSLPKVYLNYKDTEFTEAQVRALVGIHERYDVVFDPSRFARDYSLPEGYVAGRVGGFIYVGVNPEGHISS